MLSWDEIESSNARLNDAPQTTMRVTKRSGHAEPVDVNKIVRAVSRSCGGLPDVDALRVATKTISGLYDGATTRELDQLSIQTAAALIAEEPQYARLAGRLLSTFVDKEVRGQEIQSFSQSVAVATKLGIVGERLATFVAGNARKLNDAIVLERDRELEYFGLRTLYDRYLLKHPQTREVIETPQQFFLRVACALSQSVTDALELYRLLSTLEYLPSSPTLFNAGTRHEQLSSCFLLDSPADHLEDIYKKYMDVALLSKFSGGIGLAYHRVRSQGSLIESTNGHSNGIVPWLKTLDASVSAVNQGGKRKGACCVYLEPWHADIEQFLELRDNTGDEQRRTHNLNLANWINDLFMRRVESDAAWTLFDPKDVPQLPDLWGDAFDAAYLAAEEAGLGKRVLPARELYAKMMRTLAQTGNGWMTFKDKSNRACNQTAKPGRTVHLSNLCTEIIEVTNADEIAVCNLGSINLSRHVHDGTFDFDKLATTVRVAVRQLDRVIDLNYYPGRGDEGLEPALAARRPRRDGPPRRVLQAAPAVRRAGRARAVGAHRRGGVLPRAVGVGRARSQGWQTSRVRRDARGRRRAAVRRLGRDARRGALGAAARRDRAAWPAQLATLRHRADGDDRVDRRLLRVHRAADLERVEARDAVGRLPAGEPLSRRRAQAARPVERAHALAAQARRGLGAGHAGAADRPARDLSHGVGGADALAHRHGRRPRRIPRPEPVAQPLHGEPEHRSALEHVLPRVEARPEDDVLPALATGDAHHEDDGRRASEGERGDRLLAREPRELRGLPVSTSRPARLLDPGLCLSLRPMSYPRFYEMYRAATKNTWSVEEVDFSTDVRDLAKMSPAERHLVERLVAFFATGDSIVANNLVLSIYRHVNAPEARMYLSRQLYEEALHVQFYLTLLDTYVPDPEARHRAFSAIDTIPSIRKKADFCLRWLDTMAKIERAETIEQRRIVLLNLICFAACVEGLFFFGAFAYVYFLRSRGLLHGLSAGTSWVFRDESCHMAFAFEVVRTAREEEPALFSPELERQVTAMIEEAIDCEVQFAEDLLQGGIAGLSLRDVRAYLEHCADQRLATLGCKPRYGSKNPLGFMELQDVQEVTNFFERRVSAYQTGVTGEFSLDSAF